MNNQNKYNFQYCQKIVVFSQDFTKVLLCKRKDEADYNEVYSFIGGKMETTDEDIITAIQREKNEEVGKNFKVKIYTEFSNNLIFKKKSGDYMILPHYLSIHVGGDIQLNEEYSKYQWVNITDLEQFEPKIKNIPESVNKLLKLKTIMGDKNLKVI